MLRCEAVGWIRLAQDMVQWRALVSTVMNFLETTLTVLVTIIFLRRTLLLGDR
jgi:hypothetical protein